MVVKTDEEQKTNDHQTVVKKESISHLNEEKIKSLIHELDKLYKENTNDSPKTIPHVHVDYRKNKKKPFTIEDKKVRNPDCNQPYKVTTKTTTKTQISFISDRLRLFFKTHCAVDYREYVTEGYEFWNLTISSKVADTSTQKKPNEQSNTENNGTSNINQPDFVEDINSIGHFMLFVYKYLTFWDLWNGAISIPDENNIPENNIPDEDIPDEDIPDEDIDDEDIDDEDIVDDEKKKKKIDKNFYQFKIWFHVADVVSYQFCLNCSQDKEYIESFEIIDPTTLTANYEEITCSNCKKLGFHNKSTCSLNPPKEYMTKIIEKSNIRNPNEDTLYPPYEDAHTPEDTDTDQDTDGN